MALDSLLASLKSGVTEVAGVQACRTKALACNPAQLTEVAEVSGVTVETKAATPETLPIKTEVTAKPALTEACTCETPVTPETARGQVGAGDMAIASRWWLIHHVDHNPREVVCYPEATHAEILERYPEAVAAEPFNPMMQTPSAPMSADEETAIRTWLALIGEADPATITDVIAQCQRDADARDYFTGRTAAALSKPDPFADDRRTCSQCQNLRGQACIIAKPERGALVVANRGYRPAPDTLQRCAGYSPLANDSDQRNGAERWPGLTQKGSE